MLWQTLLQCHTGCENNKYSYYIFSGGGSSSGGGGSSGSSKQDQASISTS